MHRALTGKIGRDLADITGQFLGPSSEQIESTYNELHSLLATKYRFMGDYYLLTTTRNMHPIMMKKFNIPTKENKLIWLGPFIVGETETELYSSFFSVSVDKNYQRIELLTIGTNYSSIKIDQPIFASGFFTNAGLYSGKITRFGSLFVQDWAELQKRLE